MHERIMACLRGISVTARDTARMADNEAPVAPAQTAHKPVVFPPLTTPCTVLALHNWLKSVAAVTTGDHWESNIATTATSISVS
jgi:hypothetical protein